MAFIGIFGTLLGVIIAYFLSLRAAKLQCRRIAGAKLRAAFAPEIAKYYLNMKKGDKWYINMMTKMFEEALPRHAAAIEEYRCFISSKSNTAYQQAWENYHNNFLDYWDEGEGGGEQILFRERIDAVFKFTEI
jgi:hypothetical protein